uniref:G2/mitotic-specific cyclin-B2 n=1 Tax=Labrus bergylta TaxID=56723 RepID=A0A3Q3N147_9LABR
LLQEKILTAISQVQRPKQRTVLGVLSENEQRCRSQSQLFFSTGKSVLQTQFNLRRLPAHLSWLSLYCLKQCETAPGTEFKCDVSMQSENDKYLMSEQVLCVSQYAQDIHRHLRESEIRLRPMSGYLDKHPEITISMRVILVDWLVEVVEEYQLRSETLHLAVNYLDRFLSCVACVKRGKLQLVGTAALMIAAKYEEISPPELSEFVYTTDSTYTKKQLVRMEHVFLRVLAFKMAAPTINQFLQLFMSIQPLCANSENLAQYLAELSLLEIDPFLQYNQSTVAAAAYCLGIYTINRSLWPDSLHYFTGYTMGEIVPCLNELHKLYISAESRPQQAIREKYKSSKYCRVSLITPPAVPPFL